MNLTIRQGTRQDLPAILDIYRLAGLNTRGTTALAKAEKIFARMSTYPDYRIFVADVDGRIVGTFALLIMENLANSGAPSGIVEDVAVVPDFQRHGVGKAMMELAMSICQTRACYKLVLSSNQQRDEAHRFYLGLGFKQHGISFFVEFGTPNQTHSTPATPF
jgi:GNAT superfamily N-acetyltransferase